VCGSDEKGFDEIIVFGFHAQNALAAASLGAVGGDGTSFDVAAMGHGDDHVLVRDHVLDVDVSLVAGRLDNGRFCGHRRTVS